MTAARPALVAALVLIGLFACSGGDPDPRVGRPDGPYRMTLTAKPEPPIGGQPTVLTTRLTHRATGAPVHDLQVLHERRVHNFIVNLDFSSFAHIHHEDFAELTPADLEHATHHFPYAFPQPGNYRMVSEFTHRDRTWTKHFDIEVGGTPPPRPAIDLAREKTVGRYRATLSASPSVPVAGFETELVLNLARDGQPVTDLELILGSEVHLALWRIDGQYFGHGHSYTPHMAAMLARMHDRGSDAATRARLMQTMMIEMINATPELVFPGPQLPLRYVFPEAGTYAIFLHCAPGGEPTIFSFMIEVERYQEGMDTQIESIVDVHAGHQPQADTL